MSEKVLLAYSGGLDTSCILKWLLEKGYEVICFIADVGQDENFEEASAKALKIGAQEVVVKDLRKEFVENYVWPSIQMGLIYEERYLLGTSLARPCITVGLVEVAKAKGAKLISHGATGKGNDQVRFELNCYALLPGVKIIAPWRNEEFCRRFQGRVDLLQYANQHGIPVSVSPSAPWSMDANILHISYESGILEDPANYAPENLYQMTKSPLEAPRIVYKLAIVFEKGLPVKVEDIAEKKSYVEPLEMLKVLNQIGGKYGIGRIDIVENRFVGLKSRGCYETPGGTILFTAHQDLEIFCLDREVYRLKSQLREKMSDFVYNGLWFSPEAKYARWCLEHSQEHVSGTVWLDVNPGFVRAVGRKSAKALYNKDLVSMDAHGDFSPNDASGFIAINALRIREYSRVFGDWNFEA